MFSNHPIPPLADLEDWIENFNQWKLHNASLNYENNLPTFLKRNMTGIAPMPELPSSYGKASNLDSDIFFFIVALIFIQKPLNTPCINKNCTAGFKRTSLFSSGLKYILLPQK